MDRTITALLRSVSTTINANCDALERRPDDPKRLAVVMSNLREVAKILRELAEENEGNENHGN